MMEAVKAKLLKIDVFKNRAALSTRKLCCSLDIVLILFPCKVYVCLGRLNE